MESGANKIFKLFRFISLGLALLTILLTVLSFSSPVYNHESLWLGISFTNGKEEIAYAVSVILFGLECIMFILGIYATLKKKNILMIIYSLIILFTNIIIVIILSSIASGLVYIIINIVLSAIAIVLLLLYISKNKNIKEEELAVNDTVPKLPILILTIIGLVIFLVMFFIPVVKYTGTQSVPNSNIIIFDGITKSAEIYTKILFICYLLYFITITIYFINSLMYYRNYDRIFAEKINTLINVYFATSLVIFIACFLMTIIGTYSLVFGSFLPFLLMIVIKIIFSIYRGRYIVIDEKKELKQMAFGAEPTIYQAIITIITLCVLFVRVIEVEYQYMGHNSTSSFNGIDLLQTYKELGSGYQVLSFVILAVMITSVIMLVLSLCSYFAKYKEYHKLTNTTIFTNVILLCILGLSGFYFKIAQKINEENITSLLSSLGIPFSFDYLIDIRSQLFLLAAPALVVLIIAIFRGKLIPSQDTLVAIMGDDKKDSSSEPSVGSSPISQVSNKPLGDFDACPVFTELDGKKEQYDLELKEKEKFTFENPTLPGLVNFIVDYACESRLHLSYKKEDIATFIAGLGASRLTILQGMSGTGKTSLPKIFSEAIFGNCEIIEVESSWRDKNELLGYYNEFSKSYSPKKFTQRLYKAKLNPNIITFIVLDEMNLSRIEYYFSDFLSLMENEEDKREIKLLNVKLERTVGDERYGYLALEEGHTIKIPTNVWFIGTANRDESTFEISDKVYDRAQTMNFNKRAPKARPEGRDVPQRYLSYEVFSNLLKDAINKGTFEAEDNEIIKEVEKIMQPFNISFGNRVLKQIEEFVKIYCACFGNSSDVLNEAIEKILLSKVVAKLEFKNVENKDKLVKQFNRLNLEKCSEFVSKLNED